MKSQIYLRNDVPSLSTSRKENDELDGILV